RARGAVLGVRLQGRARVPRLPRLYDEAALRLRVVRQAPRARVAGVPVLRDAGDLRRARPVAAEDAALAALVHGNDPRRCAFRVRLPGGGAALRRTLPRLKSRG